jgi:hypothetical protein
MPVSAEIRWFWPTSPPPRLQDWFCDPASHPCAAGGGLTRSDEYLRDPQQAELGLKCRGGKKGVEVKALVAARASDVAAPPFAGPIELWTKWTSERLDLPDGSTLTTQKRRWLRKFATTSTAPQEIALNEKEQPREEDQPLPPRGCNVELTEVSLPHGDVWWTLGFEAFGSIRTVEDDLRAVATELAARRPPEFGNGLLLSYPAWLKQIAGATFPERESAD